jgi:hypothetical protein
LVRSELRTDSGWFEKTIPGFKNLSHFYFF